MKERPILMSGPLVLQTLAGLKTQTRRVVKFQDGGLVHSREDATWRLNSDGLWYPCVDFLGRGIMDPLGAGIRCPYGQPGDRLWVRETWAPIDSLIDGFEREDATCIGYRADLSGLRHEGEPPIPLDVASINWDRVRWRPSIFMPRWASRLTLSVESVRVERLQDISEEDARAEGVCETDWYDNAEAKVSAGAPWSAEILAFADLWQHINAARPGCSWEANPWVWVVGYSVAEIRR